MQVKQRLINILDDFVVVFASLFFQAFLYLQTIFKISQSVKWVAQYGLHEEIHVYILDMK
jgi:hypothetical protein